jgi:hypothetical protein
MKTQIEINNMKQSEWCIGIGRCTANCKCYEQELLDGKRNNCKHENIKREDGLDECLDCGVRNY